MMTVQCLNCGRPYPETGAPYRCPRCGGLFDEAAPLAWNDLDRRLPGIWNYLAGSAEAEKRVSLGEGNTPLVAVEALGRRVYLKCEYANPTGSFKDRGTAALISFLVSRDIRAAVEDSSGNAGASFAAYAAHAGIAARVFVPEGASGPKRAQIEKFGAQVVPVPGPRSNAAIAAEQAAADGATYASHSHLPHSLVGYATCAYEIAQVLEKAPGSLIVPVGQGGLLLGMGRGFEALFRGGLLQQMPVLVGVQAAACAPLAALDQAGRDGLNLVTEGETLAEGVRVRAPLRAAAVLGMVHRTNGRFLAVAENAILPGRDALARLGFYVEPTSALVWQALVELGRELPDPVVLVLTGSAYKARL